MRFVLTAQEIQQFDKIAIESYKIPGVVLMENAGIKIVEFMNAQFESCQPVFIFCGKGNNGGDGFVVARHLLNQGYPVHLYLTCDPDEFKGDALTNIQILKKMDIQLNRIHQKDDLPVLVYDGFIVDALLGTGISGDVRGIYRDIIEWINQQDVPVVSIDLPSGLNATTGAVSNICIQADFTITMSEFKRGLLMPPGILYAGDVFVADIGFPKEIGSRLDPKTYILQKKDIYNRLPIRAVNGHKGDFGKVAVLAGSRGLTGAAILASTATLRAGAGLTKLGIPESLNTIIESQSAEVMTIPLPETESGSLSFLAKNKIAELLDWADVFIAGPGLSQHFETKQLIEAVLTEYHCPAVLDADGINMFEGNIQFIQDHFSGILTPHPGELSRLIQVPLEEILADPIETARHYAKELGCVLVLKGAPTVIASKDGDVYINSTGNSGLATGGSGDVLTGIIGGLLAQRINLLDAALCGVYLHGLAGDLVAANYNERSLIASDLLNNISDAFNSVEEVS